MQSRCNLCRSCYPWPWLSLLWLTLWYSPENKAGKCVRPVCLGVISVLLFMWHHSVLYVQEGSTFFWSAEAQHMANKDARSLHWAILWWSHVAWQPVALTSSLLLVSVWQFTKLTCSLGEREEKLSLKACSWISPKLLGSRVWLWTALSTSGRIYILTFSLFSKSHSPKEWPFYRSWGKCNWYLTWGIW